MRNKNRARGFMQVRRSRSNSRSRSKRGVSPVIGVILMVAATIVIAGVVMAMLGGFKTPTTTPAVSLSAENYVETSGKDIVIKHNGGDTLKSNDYAISVVEVGDPENYTTDISDDFEVGNSIFVESCTDGAKYYGTNNTITGGTDFESGKDYSVKVKHISSNTILLDKVVTVRGT